MIKKIDLIRGEYRWLSTQNKEFVSRCYVFHTKLTYFAEKEINELGSINYIDLMTFGG